MPYFSNLPAQPQSIIAAATTMTTEYEPDEERYPHVCVASRGPTRKDDDASTNRKYDLIISISADSARHIIILRLEVCNGHEWKEYTSLVTKLESLHNSFLWIKG